MRPQRCVRDIASGQVSSTAVVIGAGVNELVCAHYLARAGRRVMLLQQHRVDDSASPDVGWVPPCIVRDLALDERGLKIVSRDPWVATALPDGGRLELWHDLARSVEAIRRLSVKDAAKWPEFCARMSRLARLLEKLYIAAPPDPVSRELGELAQLAGIGLRIRSLGRRGIEDLLRLLPMSVADLLDDWFESDALKGVIGAAGVTQLQQGPRSGGTAYTLLHHHVGSPAGVFRPPLSNIGSVLAKLPGVDIRRGTEIAQIVIRESRVTGVVLANGEEIAANLVISGADPRRTFLRLVDPGWFAPEFVRAVQHIRCRGVTARVTLALDRPPGFSTLAVAPSLDYIERAYDDAKYGRVSQLPYLEATSAASAADHRHRIDIHMQYAPYALAGGEWDADRRAALGDLAVKVLSQYWPDLGASVLERSVLSPLDLEDGYGYPEGQANHAELALDQAFWMRPVPGWARYRTPIAGLYLCGPGTHPGGVSGIPGYNAAREIIRDSKPRNRK